MRWALCFALLVACSGATTLVPDGGDPSDATVDAGDDHVLGNPLDASDPPDVSTADVADAGSEDATNEEGGADSAIDSSPGDASAADATDEGRPPQVCCQLTQALYGYTTWCGCNNNLGMHGFPASIDYVTDGGSGLCYSSVPSASGDCAPNAACTVSVQGGGSSSGYCQ